jgi:hypothetical protein
MIPHITVPDWITIIGLLVTIELGVVNGTIKLTNAIPDAWVPRVQAWCGILAAIGGAIITALSRMVSVVLVTAFALSFLVAGGAAQAQTARRQPVDPLSQLVDKAKADFTKKTGVEATGDVPFDLLRALDAKLLPDLTYAKKLADATGSKVTSTCYGAWIDMINVQQTAVQTKNADGTTTDLATPDPHLITDFERAVELRNALQPDSPFMVACSPVANMIKQDVVQFMAAVVAGNVSIATLVPGL